MELMMSPARMLLAKAQALTRPKGASDSSGSLPCYWTVTVVIGKGCTIPPAHLS